MSADLRVHAPRATRPKGPVVLTLSHQSPMPPTAGNEYRLWDMLEALGDAGYRCIPIVCPLTTQEAERALEALVSGGSEFVLCHRDGSVDAALHDVRLSPRSLAARGSSREWEERRWRALGGELRERESHYTTPPMRAVFEVLAESLDPHAVIANYVFSAGLLELAPRPALRMIDTIDVFSRQYLPGVEGHEARKSTLTAEQEALLLQSGDVVIAIQAVEAVALTALAPSAHVLTCGVSFPYRPVEIDEAAASRLVVLGSDNPLNVQGLRGFLTTVWPTVLRALPEAELVVAGKLSDAVPAWAPRVRRLGFVPDVADAYRQAAVALNPAFVGTGLKIKTVEALSYGRRIVCWPAGSDGLAHLVTEDLIAVADAQEMADTLSRLLREPPRLAGRLREFDRPFIYRELLDTLSRRPSYAG